MMSFYELPYSKVVHKEMGPFATALTRVPWLLLLIIVRYYRIDYTNSFVDHYCRSPNLTFRSYRFPQPVIKCSHIQADDYRKNPSYPVSPRHVFVDDLIGPSSDSVRSMSTRGLNWRLLPAANFQPIVLVCSVEWLLIWARIQGMNLGTLAYTPGSLGLAQRTPHETIPPTNQRSFSFGYGHNSGPPESPYVHQDGNHTQRVIILYFPLTQTLTHTHTHERTNEILII